MASTTKGIVYPTSGDNIAPLETHFASLAGTADDAIGVVQTAVDLVQDNLDAFELEVGLVPQVGSYVFNGPSASATPVDITITLPGGYFSVAPVVVATVAGSSTAKAYIPMIHTITASQFQVRVWTTNSTAVESLTLQWIAK